MNERAGWVLEVNEKEMNGAAHATYPVCCVATGCWSSTGAQAPGTSALDAAPFNTHRSAVATSKIAAFLPCQTPFLVRVQMSRIIPKVKNERTSG